MNISNFLMGKNNPSHNELDFINTNTKCDSTLFIDPVLIELGNTDFCVKAKKVTKDYFDKLFDVYYNDIKDNQKRYLLKYAQEINSTHLGYATKNGKGNTEDGLLEIFEGIEEYVNTIKMTHPLDVVLCVPNFAEDGMSDLLTNVLYKELSDFTIAQCKKYGYHLTDNTEERYYWNADSHSWSKYQGSSMIIDGKTFLLVPKEIVQTHYRFTCDNYLRSVIVENICEDRAVISRNGDKARPPKGDVREELLKKNGTVYQTVINYTKDDDSLLKQYHSIVTQKYQTLKMNDEEINLIVYGKNYYNS